MRAASEAHTYHHRPSPWADFLVRRTTHALLHGSMAWPPSMQPHPHRSQDELQAGAPHRTATATHAVLTVQVRRGVGVVVDLLAAGSPCSCSRGGRGKGGGSGTSHIACTRGKNFGHSESLGTPHVQLQQIRSLSRPTGSTDHPAVHRRLSARLCRLLRRAPASPRLSRLSHPRVISCLSFFPFRFWGKKMSARSSRNVREARLAAVD